MYLLRKKFSGPRLTKHDTTLRRRLVCANYQGQGRQYLHKNAIPDLNVLNREPGALQSGKSTQKEETA